MTGSPKGRRGSRDVLRGLMDASADAELDWSADEMSAILLHQLDTALLDETDAMADQLDRAPEDVEERLRRSGCTSFADVLLRDCRAADAIQAVKEYAKAAARDGQDIPRDVARVLYVLAILRGRAAGIAAITSLDASSVEREARRCLTQGWLPESVREALRRLVEAAQ